MRAVVKIFALSLLMVPIFFSGCGGSSADTNPGASTPTTADFFHLAVVPNRVVTTSTFEVQVIAENINPASPPTAPVVIDADNKSHTMVLRTLRWPGTLVDSVTVYAADVPLLANQVNNIKVVSGTKEISFSVRHKATQNIQHANNSGQLVSLLQAATTSSPFIDVIEVDYAESDLGSVIDNIGSNTVTSPTTRTTWLTVRPGTGSITWLRNSPVPYVAGTNRRPKLDFLNLDGVAFGSLTSDGGGYQYYPEPGHRIWFSNTTFIAKYNTSWSRENIITSPYQADIRSDPVEAQKIYFTDCSWSGTASNGATQFVQLARDLRLSSHRGDISQFGKVVLNVSAQDMFDVKIQTTPLDYTHNDGFQIWGSVSDIAIKGIRVTSPNIPLSIQPFLFDRSFTPNYSLILLDTVIFEGALPALPLAPTTVVRAQLAGVISNSRISNISFPEQGLTIRQDFTEPNGAFSPTNVRIHNVNVWGVEYSPPTSGYQPPYSSAYGNVGGNPADISGILNSISSLSGATFSSVRVK